jgi:hypothetical protein
MPAYMYFACWRDCATKLQDFLPGKLEPGLWSLACDRKLHSRACAAARGGIKRFRRSVQIVREERRYSES